MKLSDLAQASRDFIGYCSRLAGTGRHVVVNNTDVIAESKVVLKRSGDSWMHQMELVSTRIPETYQPFIFCTNPQYAFGLRREQSKKDWVLTELNQMGHKKEKTGKRFEDMERLLCRHYRVHDIPLDRLVEQPEFKILKKENEDTSVKVTFSAKRFSGWMRLMPSEKWHVSDYSIDFDNRGIAGTFRVSHEVKMGKSGFPILSKRKQSFTGNMGPGDIILEEYEIAEHNGLPEEDFTLSAFGLAEPDFSNWRRKNHAGWLIAFAIGIGLLLVARLVYRRKVNSTT